MIAPLRPAEPSAGDTERRLSHARRAVARSLLPAAPSRLEVRQVPAWQAWLLFAWMAVVALCYVASLVGLGS